MKRWVRGKKCAYCLTEDAVQEEHVFPRGLFHDTDRDDSPLPKAPACANCNADKSRLDEYAMTVLAFGAQHPSALKNLETRGVPCVFKNRKLHAELKAGAGQAWVQAPSGLVIPTMT